MCGQGCFYQHDEVENHPSTERYRFGADAINRALVVNQLRSRDPSTRGRVINWSLVHVEDKHWACRVLNSREVQNRAAETMADYDVNITDLQEEMEVDELRARLSVLMSQGLPIPAAPKLVTELQARFIWKIMQDMHEEFGALTEEERFNTGYAVIMTRWQLSVWEDWWKVHKDDPNPVYPEDGYLSVHRE